MLDLPHLTSLSINDHLQKKLQLAGIINKAAKAFMVLAILLS